MYALQTYFRLTHTLWEQTLEGHLLQWTIRKKDYSDKIKI